RVYKHDYPHERHERQEKTFIVEGGKTRRVAVQLRGYPKVTGIVRDQKGQPVGGAMISICPGRDDATSDSQGRFEIRWQTPEWSRAMTPHVIARHLERNLAAAVEIEEDARLIDINMTTGVVLAGKVVDVDDKPVEKAYLNLTFRSSNYGISMKREKGVTNAEGYYEIRAVPPHHEYSVNAGADGYGRNEVRITTDDVVNNRLEVEAIRLAPANLSVSGIVVNVEDKPMDDAHVFIQGVGQPYRHTLTKKDGKFTIEGVCAGSIRITANKPGTTVLSGSIQVVGGATNVRIVVNDDSAGSVPKQPPSLIGKPLPDMDGLKIELAPADVENKTMLICFWDMQQRPSRNCITKLIKRAEQLKDKSIAVIAINASNIDENMLDDWVKKNNIPFPVGRLGGDEKKIRFNWGIKSLPWLILTDRSHVIHAEGFGFDSLDNMIEEMKNVAL
ncbi:MAG TPA: hypothetical protein DIU00_02385, partial [Phycisphaerales bacterium]|nr:hypothetical protein [Phycisphaerales bacterium]